MMNLASQFRGDLTHLRVAESATAPTPDPLDLPAMARAALNYLRGNPDPARDCECKFSLGPLGIPCHVPLLPPNRYGFDPIALGDTDCRMYWQFPHMRQMAGEPEPCAVECGLRKRILSYQRPDGLLWMNPGAWVGPLATPMAKEALQHEWAFTWASGKLLWSLSEEYAQTGDTAAHAAAQTIFAALRRLACRDAAGRAFLPHGASPWRDGQWLHLQDAGTNVGWGAELSHGYPLVIEPLVRYAECTGDADALELALAFSEGHLAYTQPDMGEQRIDAVTGAFRKHVHLHTHEIWGVAHLGALRREPRYLDWAERAYRFVLAQGTDYGWYPEYVPQGEYRTEICVVGDMTSIAACLARGGKPEYWDHVERAVRNELRRAQFSLTPAFLELFRRLHADKPAAAIDAALCELRKLEGGFVAQATFDDWVGFPGSLGQPGLYANGIQMMGCCPPEGMRGFWEAWNGIVEERPDGVLVNLAFTRDHAAAKVVAATPGAGRIDVTAKRGGSFFLRPPAWVDWDSVRVLRDDNVAPRVRGGPDQAYAVVPNVRPGEVLALTWAVPEFTQSFAAQSVPGRQQTVTVRWRGNEVLAVEPRGQFLPMFGVEA